MISAKNSTKKYTSKRLFHTFCLRHRVAAAVPKANNVDNIAIDTIDQPTQIVDEYAAINLVAVFKKRVFGGNVGELTQIFSSVATFIPLRLIHILLHAQVLPQTHATLLHQVFRALPQYLPPPCQASH